LNAACDHTLPFLFADDTNLFISGSDATMLEQKMNHDVGNISEWLKCNKLSLNIKKTHFMTLRNKKVPNIKLHIDSQPIEQVNHTKFLGVIIDQNISWKNHIAYISGKVAKGIGIIKKARKYLNKETLINLYYSFIYPYLIYCNHVWGNACKSYLEPLFRLQKKIVRIICGVKPREHTEGLFLKLKLLKLEKINTYLVSRLMFKVHHGIITMFGDMFIKNKDIHNYETRQSDHYHIPSSDKEIGKANFRYNGAITWNSILILNLDLNVSDYLFAKNLKSALFQNRL